MSEEYESCHLQAEAISAVACGDTSDDDNRAILKAAENPDAGRLVFIPWSGGSLCLPKAQEDKGGADDS